MALDVHIVVVRLPYSTKDSYTSFGFEGEHEEIVQLAETLLGSGSQIARMKEYYDNTLYSNGDLIPLITELGILIAVRPEADYLRVTLEQYRELCVRAVQQDKAILLVAD